MKELDECIKSNPIVENKNQALRMPFEEYESISKADFNSNEFRAKYEKDFIIEGHMVSSNSKIIKELARKMTKSQKAVLLMVKRKFFQPSAETKNNGVIASLKVEKCADNQTILCDNSDSCNAQTDAAGSFHEKFQLEDGEIFEITQTTVKHRKKNVAKQTVKPGWPYKLGIFIFEKTKLSCKFNFQNIWVAKNGQITASGICECKAQAHITFQLNILNVEINRISRNFPHTRVYQIRGERKEELIKQLKHDSAQATRTRLVNDLNPDNTELKTNHNPFVPELNASRLLKHRDHRTDSDPIDVLLKWKDSTYQNVISAVSHSPFYIFFRSALQMAWYIVESRKHPMEISIDATGSLVAPPLRSQKIDGSEKLKHVFLYTIMAKTATKSVPIAQMLSQDQTSEFIIFFLKKVFKNLKLPVETVCDESKALLKALSVTFANCDNIERYVAACMSSLVNGTKPPSCYIRIDRSHFVKNITHKIKSRDFRKKNLFRGVIGYLIKCDNFETAKKVIQDFFTLILNEKVGFDGDDPLPAEAAKKRLLSLCSTHDESVDYTSDASELENEITEKSFDYNADSKWVHEIISKVNIAESSVQQNHENLYYSPDDKNMYVKLFSSIVLWSNLMNPLFRSSTVVATSSDVESYFKSLKSGILRSKTLQVDEFFETYINFANAEIKLNAMSGDNGLRTTTKRNRSNSMDERASISPGNLYLFNLLYLFN